MSEEPRSKRARTKKDPDQYSEEDEWKVELRDWVLTAPDRKSRLFILNRRVHNYEESYDGTGEIARLLELPTQDPVADEVFAAWMENADHCYEWHEPHTIVLGRQTDYPYSELTENSLPYLKKFLTDLPKNWKSLNLHIDSPEILRTFPDQIGNEGSALEKIEIRHTGDWTLKSYEYEESFSLGKMLYVTKNFKDVDLPGLFLQTPSGKNSSLKAFQSQTKTIDLWGIITSNQPLSFLHPDTKIPLESICECGLNEENFEFSKQFWRQFMQASKQTLSTIKISRITSEHFLAAMCTEAANQDLENLKTIGLSFRTYGSPRSQLRLWPQSLIQPLSRLARSRSGSRLKRLELEHIKDHFLPTQSAHTFASFENLEHLIIFFNKEKCDPFLSEYLSLEPPALRKIELDLLDLSEKSLKLLFSNKTLESIKLVGCWERDFFSTCKESFSTKLRSLDIWAGETYDAEHILSLLAALPDLRCLQIDGVKMMDRQDMQYIVSGISKHQKLCFFECLASKRSLRCKKDGRPRQAELPTRQTSPNMTPNWWINGFLRLACLRNRLKASEKQLPLGLIPAVITRSEEIGGESGIFQFLKENYPSYAGS